MRPVNTKNQIDRVERRIKRLEKRRELLEVKHEKVQQLRRLPYLEYLKTPHWKEMRNAALRRARNKCQLCSSGKNLTVHHNTYKNIGNERPEELVVLCHTCHSKFHNNLPSIPIIQ